MTLNIFTVHLLHVWFSQEDNFQSFATCFKSFSVLGIVSCSWSTAPHQYQCMLYEICSWRNRVLTSILCLWIELKRCFFMLLKNKQQKTHPKQKKKNKTKHQPAIEMLMSSWRPSDIGQIPGSGLNKSSTLNGINKTICLSKKGKKGEKEKKKEGGMWGQ